MSETERLPKKQRDVLFTLLKRRPKTLSMAAVALYLDMSVNGVSQVYGALSGKGLAGQQGPSKGGDTQILATNLAVSLYTKPKPGVQNPPGHYDS